MKLNQDIKNFLECLHRKSHQMIRLVTADNSSVFTNFGTNTYIIGEHDLVIIDPGPNLSSHFENIRLVVGSANVSHIVLTHSHQDHCSLAIKLAREYGSKIYLNNNLKLNKNDLFKRIQGDSSIAEVDAKLTNQVQIRSVNDYEEIFNDEWCLEVITTPGHMFDHICLALKNTVIEMV